MAHSRGTKPNQAKTVLLMGSGPASGNGNSSRHAESAAANHNFHPSKLHKERCIQGRVYSIRLEAYSYGLLEPVMNYRAENALTG